MSLPISIKITCANCQHEDDYIDWASTHSFGSPDLDTRPPADYRSALNQMLVKKCNNCGYCNTKIDECLENINEIVKSVAYQNQLKNIQFPEKANQFLCKSIVLEKTLDLENAAWASLHAAWNCDDNEKYVQSKYCRIRAIELFSIAKATTTLNFKKDGDFSVLLVDLYRRTEQFDIASKICEIRLTKEKDELLKQILMFQQSLILLKEIKMYKIQNAVDYYQEKIQDLNQSHNSNFSELYEHSDHRNDNNYERDYFDTITDGQLGDYDDFNGNMDNIDTWARG